MKQIFKKIDILTLVRAAVIAVMFLFPASQMVQAQLLGSQDCTKLGPGLRCSDTTLTGMIITVIGWMLALAGLIAVLFLIVGGFWYITSAGNEEQAEKGKGTVINAIIGIIIIVLSYIIVQVVSKLFASNNASGV